MEGNHPQVHIIVLNWNGLKDTIECLDSLKAIAYPNYQVILVDNASSGNDVEALRNKYGESIEIVENDRNYGYGKGFIIGIQYAFTKGAKYVLLLQNDTTVAPDFLDKLMDAAQSHPNFGILSPICYLYDQPGKVQHAGEKARWFGLRSKDISKLGTGSEEVVEATWIPIPCLLLEKENIIRMGVLQAMSDYFLYGDPIWHLCSLKSGLKVGCVPKAKIWHKGSRSLKAAGWSRMKWIVKDNFVLRYRFLTSGYFSSITTTDFIFFFCWLFLHRPPSFILLFFRSLFHGGLRGTLSGLKEGLSHIFRPRQVARDEVPKAKPSTDGHSL